MNFKLVPEFFLLILFLSFSNLVGKSNNKEINILRDGLSFSIPEHWQIIANDSLGHGAYYFSAEKTGKNSTGLISIAWINRIESVQKTIETHQKNMAEANVYRNSGIEFSILTATRISGYKVEKCLFTSIVNGQKINGEIYCFNTGEKTITVFFQSGILDQKLNDKAFELFKLTFNSRN